MQTEAAGVSQTKDADLFITDCLDDARYLVMRTIRLVFMLASEVAIPFSLAFTLRSLVYWFFPSPAARWGHWTIDWTFYPHPGVGVFVWASVMCLAFMGIYMFGMPYRFETTKPGLNARRCHRCRIAIQDTLSCSNCKAFRPARIVSAILWALSMVVTAVFAVHDAIAFLFVVFFTGGKK